MKILVATAILSLLSQSAVAFPSVLEPKNVLEKRKAAKPGCHTSKKCDAPVKITNKDIGYDPKNPTETQKISKARTNCGFQGPCRFFNAKKQYVSTTGKHRYASPVAGQIRGPCPGLNAAANHGYLPRSGVPNILQTITGLGQAYGMSIDLGGFLAAYAVALDGDVISLAWSIGGPPPKSTFPVLGGSARGISYSHNKYEGDTSIGRCDAYINGGDAHSLSLTRFKYAYEAGMDDDRYTLDKFSIEFAKNTHRSIQTNPKYFAPLFSTTLVSPAAYNFVINFMSNRTAENKSGYLNGKMFKQFFGVTGDYPNFKWIKGQERIPDNWYRRTDTNQYTAVSVFQDLLPEFAAYPDSFRFGGNTDGVNSYLGIDISNFSGGAYENAADLLKGDNFACFVYQNLQQGIPDIVTGPAYKLLLKFMNKAFGSFSCSAIAKIDPAAYDKYPGNGVDYEGTGSTC